MIRAVLDANVIVSAVLTRTGIPAQILDAWREITLNVVRNDPTYNRYLECALEGAADYVVSGDQDLLDLHEHSGIRIVSPRVFLETLRSHHRLASRED